MRAGLDRLVHVLRPGIAVAVVLLLVAAYWLVVHPWMTNWGSTADEQAMALPGDELRPDGVAASTVAITIDAPPEAIWPWLVQVGQDRAGFYTYTWMENLFGTDIHNADVIVPEWQHLAIGDSWRLVPPDFLWGVGRDAASPVLAIEPGRALVLRMWGAFVIEPIDDRTSRLLVRGDAMPPNPALAMTAEPVVFLLQRRMLRGIEARAEGRPETPVALSVVAWIGWAAAGLVVAVAFIGHRRRRYWTLLPVAATTPALLMSRDPQAALAGFLAAGITVLGFLAYGRRWFGPLLVIASVVLLTLLLAPDAFVAIGLAFAGLLVAGALSLANEARSSTAAAAVANATRARG